MGTIVDSKLWHQINLIMLLIEINDDISAYLRDLDCSSKYCPVIRHVKFLVSFLCIRYEREYY